MLYGTLKSRQLWQVAKFVCLDRPQCLSLNFYLNKLRILFVALDTYISKLKKFSTIFALATFRSLWATMNISIIPNCISFYHHLIHQGDFFRGRRVKALILVVFYLNSSEIFSDCIEIWQSFTYMFYQRTTVWINIRFKNIYLNIPS